MKKLKFLFLSVLLFSFFPILPVYSSFALSDTKYLRIITENTPFYSDVNLSDFLCFLPYTYYVKVINYGENCVHVEIGGENSTKIDGFVPNGVLYSDNLSVSSPYPEIAITSCSSTLFYKDDSLTSPVQFLFNDRTLKYFGYVKDLNGKIYYYASYNDKLGYVCEDDVIPFSIPNHPNELTFIEPETQTPSSPPSQDPDTTENKDDYLSLKLVILIIFVIAGVVALILAFKPRRKRGENYYDENEYE